MLSLEIQHGITIFRIPCRTLLEEVHHNFFQQFLCVVLILNMTKRTVKATPKPIKHALWTGEPPGKVVDNHGQSNIPQTIWAEWKLYCGIPDYPNEPSPHRVRLDDANVYSAGLDSFPTSPFWSNSECRTLNLIPYFGSVWRNKPEMKGITRSN